VASLSQSEPPDEYEALSASYDLIYADWRGSIRRQCDALDRLIRAELGTGPLSVLDASCGIGTQAIGLARLGYRVHGADVSPAQVERARCEAVAAGVTVPFAVADMRQLESRIEGRFDVVLSADNAVAHLLTEEDLALAARSMRERLCDGGLLVVTTRDYDALLREKPRASTPGVFDGPEGRRIVFHVFDWDREGDSYRTNIFLLRQSGDGWTTLHWSACSRAWRRGEIDRALSAAGFAGTRWSMPEESGFFQPLVTARRGPA
jgi:SAM-dependent methyltransferase